MRATANTREVHQLLNHAGADAATLKIGMSCELLDEHRPHVAVVEIAWVYPVVIADAGYASVLNRSAICRAIFSNGIPIADAIKEIKVAVAKRIQV